MRLRSSVVRRLISKELVAESLTGTPSIMTRVCDDEAPRIETLALLPGDPVWNTCSEGVSRSASSTWRICCDWIDLPLTTDAAVPNSPIGVGMRVAVTTITMFGSFGFACADSESLFWPEPDCCWAAPVLAAFDAPAAGFASGGGFDWDDCAAEFAPAETLPADSARAPTAVVIATAKTNANR